MLVLLFSSACYADRVPAVISKSSDGRYELRQRFGVDASAPDSFGIAVFDTETNTDIGSLPGIYDTLHVYASISLWLHTLPMVALAVPDACRFSHIEIFSVRRAKIR